MVWGIGSSVGAHILLLTVHSVLYIQRHTTSLVQSLIEELGNKEDGLFLMYFSLYPLQLPCTW